VQLWQCLPLWHCCIAGSLLLANDGYNGRLLVNKWDWAAMLPPKKRRSAMQFGIALAHLLSSFSASDCSILPMPSE
jgi:hypothetical protein